MCRTLGMGGDGRGRRIRPLIPGKGCPDKHIILTENQESFHVPVGDNLAGWALKQEADLDAWRWGVGCRFQVHQTQT